jgi:hypothetical protein
VLTTYSVKVHLLKLSDGKLHPRARKPLLEFEIPLSPTQNGWQLESFIWENRLGCLFTSILGDDMVDCLVVWDWTTGDLVRVRTIQLHCSIGSGIQPQYRYSLDVASAPSYFWMTIRSLLGMLRFQNHFFLSSTLPRREVRGTHS